MEPNYMEMVMAGHHEKKGDREGAKKFYLKAIAKAPSSKAHERLGLMAMEEEDMEVAREHFESALGLDPYNRVSLYKMGIIERLSGNYEKSMLNYRKLMESGVDDAGLYTSMGVLYSETGDDQRALEFYERAIKKNPESPLVKFNYSLCLMGFGDFKKGLELYESRIWHAKPPGKEWKGEGGVRLLVAPEQGNGDIIQFSRYLPLLKTKCKKVTVLCNAPLIDLISKIEGVDEVFEFNPGDEFVEVQEERPGDQEVSDSLPFDRFVRIMSIPQVLGLDPPSHKFKRYIEADKDKTESWSRRINSEKLKVGLCWQGGKRDKPDMVAIDKKRSVRLKEMEPILSVKDAEFFSLQLGDDQASEFVQIKDFMGESKSFSDTAAIIENLDLVISVDTAVAHLAAALEKPTWMLSRKGGCWRWGFEGESTFWYPSMRIYRQEEIGVWGKTMEKLAFDLSKFVQEKK